MDATHIDNASQNTSSWANSVGVQLAMNGDFHKSGPMRVYGDAVGSGIPWPIVNTGVDSAYSSEWYFGKYGWIAFGHDWVDYTYTEWVKNNPSSFSTAVGGWMSTTTSLHREREPLHWLVVSLHWSWKVKYIPVHHLRMGVVFQTERICEPDTLVLLLGFPLICKH